MEDNRPVHTVFIGQLCVQTGACSLAVYGLGSCVALLLYDSEAGVGGLAHVLLPGEPPRGTERAGLPAKYGVEALPSLSKALVGVGARPARMRAALVGGARLFQGAELLDTGIGARNVERLRALLAEGAVPLALELTGGSQGRTLRFDLPECLLRVRTLRGGWESFGLGGGVA